MNKYAVPWDLLPCEVSQITKAENGWEMFGSVEGSTELHCFGKVWEALHLPEAKVGETFYRLGFDDSKCSSRTRLTIYRGDLGYNMMGYPLEKVRIDRIEKALYQSMRKKFRTGLPYIVELRVLAQRGLR